MYSYDQQMSEIHALLGWCSVAVFLIRGVAFQFSPRWAGDSRLRVLVFCVGVMITTTGLSLWVLRHHNPVHDGWMLAKLIALAAYVACDHWAMGLGSFQRGYYLGGVVCLAYVMAVSLTRQVGLGLF